jgi:hypothetical protein
MENNLIKSENILIDPSIFIGDNYWNESPFFKDIINYDYTFWSTSALRDRGNILFPRAGGIDLNGMSNSGLPDIGAYEY